jgi:Domain of unknown function (DUF4167)
MRWDISTSKRLLKVMRDSFHKGARQRSSNRRSGSGFSLKQVSVQQGRGDNGAAWAKRQYERYLAVAQAALLSGDAIEVQNFYQHAEHYYRTMRGQDA